MTEPLGGGTADCWKVGHGERPRRVAGTTAPPPAYRIDTDLGLLFIDTNFGPAIFMVTLTA
jgi:hypothetical protein